MKTILRIALTLLTFVTLVSLPNSFAQEGNSPERKVRVVYFLPNDRQPQPDIDTKLDTLIKDVQRFYADEMERHGFDRKTFRLETDEDGNAIVHHVKGRYGDAHYRNNTEQSVFEETEEQFDRSKNIYFYVIDASSEVLYFNDGEGEACGQGAGGTGGGHSTLPASGACIVGDFGFTNAAHELGHAFGLAHDFHDDAYIMSYGHIYRSKLSLCHAEWLNAHRYFNAAQTSTHNSETMIKMLPSEISPPHALRLRFQINDPDGLHHVRLLTPATEIYEGVGFPKLLDCKSLNGDNNTVEFITTELALAHSEKEKLPIILQVMDVNGNFRWEWIETPIDFQFPQGEVVSIPDANLAAAIRESLGLVPNITIRQLNMLKLTRLEAEEREITDLTGLEHAKRLKYLHLWSNQITDITPLTGLTQLKGLYLWGNQITDITSLTGLTQLTDLGLSRNPIQDIAPLAEMVQLEGLGLSGNQISDVNLFTTLTQLKRLQLAVNQITDIAPLTGLTQLTFLHLGGNQIKDITPLKALTQLKHLYLWDNQISDVRPLAGLVNLQRLDLQDNPINDREPLFALLRKNPDVEIYLKSDGEPLPVTLSHFRAEHTDAGVVLKWITESEVDNAGFYIYRSETKDGQFKVVNPTMIQGAGTTSERHTYTWKDTTAKPNVAYYYRIEDVSHAGVRKQLVSIRMRGLVSASGKLITSWADLKEHN